MFHSIFFSVKNYEEKTPEPAPTPSPTPAPTEAPTEEPYGGSYDSYGAGSDSGYGSKKIRYNMREEGEKMPKYEKPDGYERKLSRRKKIYDIGKARNDDDDYNMEHGEKEYGKNNMDYEGKYEGGYGSRKHDDQDGGYDRKGRKYGGDEGYERDRYGPGRNGDNMADYHERNGDGYRGPGDRDYEGGESRHRGRNDQSYGQERNNDGYRGGARRDEARNGGYEERYERGPREHHPRNDEGYGRGPGDYGRRPDGYGHGPNDDENEAESKVININVGGTD